MDGLPRAFPRTMYSMGLSARPYFMQKHRKVAEAISMNITYFAK